MDNANGYPPPIHATHACPVCGGVITARRCPTAHRRMFVCDCGYRERLPLSLRLREAGYKELPLFDGIDSAKQKA